MVCVLDCCFAGGFGAKALTAPVQARGLESELGLLEQIAGKGRIVIAASAPNERAYEDPELGHGLLTYELLTALQGAPEVVSGVAGPVATPRVRVPLGRVGRRCGRARSRWRDRCPVHPLNVVLDANTDTSYLLLPDARDLSEITRARVPQHVLFGFHGTYVRTAPAGQ